MLKRWKRLETILMKENNWWTYKRDTFQIPNGITGEYHYVHTNGSSMIIPILDDGGILLVNQYRYLCDRESLEFPCGSVKSGHDYEKTARLELEEETGFTSRSVKSVAEFNPYNGITDEICRVYIARALIPERAKPDATEEFEILKHTPGEIDHLIETNEIWDGMTLAAWTLARRHVDVAQTSIS